MKSDVLKNMLPEMFSDLKDLYNGGSYDGRMQRTLELSRAISKCVGKEIRFNHHTLPHYPVMNFDAKTVFIHLNPGVDGIKGYDEEKFEKRRWDGQLPYADPPRANESFDEFVRRFCANSTNYATIRFSSGKDLDGFERKSVRYLLDWPDSGIQLREENNMMDTIANCINVLDQKLQLELFPYGSASFDTQSIKAAIIRKPDIMQPYFESMMNIIVMHQRRFVIFGGAIFVTLFDTMGTLYGVQQKVLKSPSMNIGGKHNGNFQVRYFPWNGCEVKLGIARSFPRHDLTWAFEIMRNYGRQCAEYYMKH